MANVDTNSADKLYWWLSTFRDRNTVIQSSPKTASRAEASKPSQPSYRGKDPEDDLTRLDFARAVHDRNIAAHGLFYGSLVTLVSLPFALIAFTAFYVFQATLFALRAALGLVIGIIIVMGCALALAYDALLFVVVRAVGVYRSSGAQYVGLLTLLLRAAVGGITVVLALGVTAVGWQLLLAQWWWLFDTGVRIVDRSPGLKSALVPHDPAWGHLLKAWAGACQIGQGAKGGLVALCGRLKGMCCYSMGGSQVRAEIEALRAQLVGARAELANFEMGASAVRVLGKTTQQTCPRIVGDVGEITHVTALM